MSGTEDWMIQMPAMIGLFTGTSPFVRVIGTGIGWIVFGHSPLSYLWM